MKVAIFTEYYFPFISGVVTHIQTLKEALEDHFKKNNLPLPEGFEKPDAEHEEIPEEA